MSRTPPDLQAVLDTVVQLAGDLCDAQRNGSLFLIDGDTFHLVAGSHQASDQIRDWQERARQPWPIERAYIVKHVFESKDVFHVRDASVEADSDYFRQDAVEFGYRTVLGVPLLRGHTVIGVRSLIRPDVRPFSHHEIGLVRAFASQAAIAIDNARLLTETHDALERQIAISQILEATSQTTKDLTVVFRTIIENAVQLCHADNASIFRADGEVYRHVASATSSGRFADAAAFELLAAEAARKSRLVKERTTVVGRVLLEKATVQIVDVLADPEYDTNRSSEFMAALSGQNERTILGVPIVKGAALLGIIIARRNEVRLFSEREINVLETFARQAAIAVENTRLFNETKEALERQTALGEVLRSISSSPTDAHPVLEAVALNAARFCGSDDALVVLTDERTVRVVAHYGPVGTALGPSDSTWPLDRTSVSGRSITERRTVHVNDLQSESAEYPVGSDQARRGQYRTTLATPLLREGMGLGAIVLRRIEARPFTDKQIELLQTFADQAAIAIENARLFNETKEALGRQTALAEVLRSIAGSPTDVTPVLQAIAANAARFCGAEDAVVHLLEGGTLPARAHYGSLGVSSTLALSPGRTSVVGLAVLERRTVHVPDVLAAEADEFTDARKRAAFTGHRGLLAAPLMREGSPIGGIVLRKGDPSGFTPRQIELVEAFANQAVIAIENVRLFNETTTALERQTATADVLRLISRSAFELGTVLDSVLETAARLCGAQSGVVFRLESDGGYHPVAALGLDQAEKDLQFSFTMESPNRGNVIGRAVLDRVPAQIEDALTEPGVNPAFVELQAKLGFRTLLGVPILRDGEPIGVMSLRRNEVRPFTPQEIELVTSFADQAAIAIENVRLFNETKEALERQTAISEILRVISSSPMDVQPVLDTIAQSAARFCNANDAAVAILRDDGSTLLTDTQGGIAQAPHMFQLSHRSVTPRAIKEARLFNVADMEALPDDEFGEGKEYARQHGYRGFLAAPLLKEGRAIGAIQLRRALPGAFGPQEVERVQTFAAQAVIALDNVRLFNETKEALERQTATAEVLKVISESPTDLQPVFDSIGEHARGLCEAELVHLLVLKGDRLELVGRGRDPEARADFMRVWSLPLDRSNMAGRAILSRSTIHVADVLADPEYDETIQQGARPWNTVLAVPLMRGTEAIGAIALLRGTIRPFERRQIELVETFADQAAIAIENVRLFNETREGLEQQTAVSEVLKTISRSAFDLKPVLDIVLENAIRLAGADIGWLSRVEGERFQTIAYSSSFPADVREALARDRAAGHLGGEWRPFGSESGVMGTVLERRK